jgi:transcription elongation GreA/GreB family factor
MSEIQYMTQEGYNRLKEELEELRTTGRQEASRAIAEAGTKETSQRTQNTMQPKMPRHAGVENQ